jgi:hypothetical protein
MNFLKKLPITFTGELHKIRLINFSVSESEVEPFVPVGLEAVLIEGKAVISMVNVQLRNMKMKTSMSPFKFNYRHVGFRLLVKDADGAINRSIFFIRSFTDKPLMTFGGRILTDYRLENAKFSESDDDFTMTQGNKFLSYSVDKNEPPDNHELKKIIQVLDRAYSICEGKIRVVQIQREKWPLESIRVKNFQTNFFESAKLLGGFMVNEVIHYTWLPPQFLDK